MKIKSGKIYFVISGNETVTADIENNLATFETNYSRMDDQVKFCGRQPLNKLKGYGLLGSPYHFKLKAVFHKIFLVHS